MLQNKSFRTTPESSSVPQFNETAELAKPRKRKRFRTSEKPIKYLSEEQVTAFFTAIEKAKPRSLVRDRALFRVIYHRGLRAAEPGKLHLEDFDQAAGTLYVRRLKGSASGIYRLVDIEAKALRSWVKVRGQAAGPLFGSRNHRPISRDQVRKLFLVYATRAGIPRDKAHPHSLKHSCGTHVLARVNDLVKVQDHLGHRSIQSTEVYAKVLGKTRNQVADQLKDWK